MPKYKFIYTVSNGAFEMDVITGLYIMAKSHSKAMDAAVRLDKIISGNYDFQVAYKIKPNPHIALKCINLISKQNCYPYVMSYKIQQNFTSENEFMGFPVFSDNDFETVSKKRFIFELNNTYHDYIGTVGFEIESYSISREE